MERARTTRDRQVIGLAPSRRISPREKSPYKTNGARNTPVPSAKQFRRNDVQMLGFGTDSSKSSTPLPDTPSCDSVAARTSAARCSSVQWYRLASCSRRSLMSSIESDSAATAVPTVVAAVATTHVHTSVPVVTETLGDGVVKSSSSSSGS